MKYVFAFLFFTTLAIAEERTDYWYVCYPRTFGYATYVQQTHLLCDKWHGKEVVVAMEAGIRAQTDKAGYRSARRDYKCEYVGPEKFIEITTRWLK